MENMTPVFNTLPDEETEYRMCSKGKTRRWSHCLLLAPLLGNIFNFKYFCLSPTVLILPNIENIYFSHDKDALRHDDDHYLG